MFAAPVVAGIKRKDETYIEDQKKVKRLEKITEMESGEIF